MDSDQLFKLHIELCERARGLMSKKNADYAERTSVFGNLEVVESVTRGGITTEQGILIRLSDKLARLFTATKRELKVEDEGVQDTLLDIINYCVLFRAKQVDRGIQAR